MTAPSTADEVRWSWILLLLDAAERSALTPIENARLHGLAFYGNTLAPVYDLPVPDGKLLKYRRGPFYSTLQWDLDRLVVMGLVEMREFRPLEDVHGWWFAARYCLTTAGFDRIPKIIETPRGARLQTYMLELTAAYGGVAEDDRDLTVDSDAIFGDPTVAMDEVIDFAEWDDRNFAVRTAQTFDELVMRGIRLVPRDRLHLYFRYLSRAVGAAAS